MEWRRTTVHRRQFGTVGLGAPVWGPGDAPPTPIHAECSKGSIPIVKQLLGENFGVAHALYHVTLSQGGPK